MLTAFSPRAKRMHSLRRLVQRAEDVLSSADPARSEPRHRELAGLTAELERELSRLEQMPWPPSGHCACRATRFPLTGELSPLYASCAAVCTLRPS